MEVRIVLNDDVGSCVVFTNVLLVERDKKFLYIYYTSMGNIKTAKTTSENIKKIIIV